MIRFPYKEKAPFKLDLIPMINVVFLLLIFFMLTSTTTLQSKKVELPTAKTAEKNSKQFLIMTIDKNGFLELDGKAMTIEALPAHLEKKVNELRNYYKNIIYKNDLFELILIKVGSTTLNILLFIISEEPINFIL